MEAWQRLLSAGLITQAPGQAARVMTLTAKGREAAGSVKFEEITMRQMLRREMLHGDLQGSVYENFASGNYDTAIRDAFVEVEIAVRAAAKLPASLVGVKLMREAFNPNTGKLTIRLCQCRNASAWPICLRARSEHLRIPSHTAKWETVSRCQLWRNCCLLVDGLNRSRGNWWQDVE
jgi:hypothetical protein